MFVNALTLWIAVAPSCDSFVNCKLYLQNQVYHLICIYIYIYIISIYYYIVMIVTFLRCIIYIVNSYCQIILSCSVLKKLWGMCKVPPSVVQFKVWNTFWYYLYNLTYVLYSKIFLFHNFLDIGLFIFMDMNQIYYIIICYKLYYSLQRRLYCKDNKMVNGI